MTTVQRIARMTDKQVLKLYDAIVEDFAVSYVSLSLSGVPVERNSEPLADAVKGKDIGVISAFSVNVGTKPTLGINFRRGTGGNSDNIDNARRPSPYFDEIALGYHSHNSQHPDAETVLQVRRLIARYTNLPSDGEVVGAASEATELLKVHFAQLSSQLVEVNTASLKRREELEDEYAQKRQQLDEELLRHGEKFREESERLAGDHQSRLEELEAREKQLDDRDHIHARRELRTQMTEAIAAQVQGALVPRNASAMRWAVFGLMLAGAAGLAGLSAWSLYEFGRLTYLASLQTTPNEQASEQAFAVAQIAAGFHWLVLARGFIAGAAATGFLLYAISWLKGIYHDEVLTRRELQRYATDLNRASWAIETIMEARSSGDLSIPDAVIAGVTRNLFEATGGKKANAEASANALAELLRTSGKARFGPNGAEFELTSRGANRLAEKLDE